ncbi:ABC transporter ATP-binding protein [Devosia limi DSM 17137]|uniref:ABC transporter ATP-binding protein n=1 Tax=Devosia limi DSM 17137 TaxID=1121477 RepID=A0A0F5LK10_9HYPH|nr:ABC transporter ATP-binding protein [Devosia limi]KKB82610.1 ABC transporter ATP-binding protein [Devosia limi DSM 17137]KKB82615.1 ABC transporter ATP-binding protein [Devosia limi DSM 17137]SHF40664.1 branched-chain amino acid transport system ATP-binding protein [Devosia limi DSM 17137]
MLSAGPISLHYGKHLALDGVSIGVDANETVVVLGANGAGKSSLLKALAGLARPAPSAQLHLDGKDLLGLPAHKFLELGIALVPEGRGIFGDLTVAENLELGAYTRHARPHEQRQRALVLDLFPRLAERQAQIARTMSGGEQQMLAIGRALMSCPRLLMLDEPSLGLAPIVTGELFQALGRIRQTGIALLVVEQNVKASLAIADRGYLMDAGRIVGTGTAEALRQDPAVQRAFLGAVA